MNAVSDPTPVLSVNRLMTYFRTPVGVVRAVDDVSFDLASGETFGIVGESGSGKSILARTIMGILPSSAHVVGSVMFGDRDILSLSSRQRRDIWGNEISMVFQDPMTSLNPVVRIGRQITEGLRAHQGLGRSEATARAVALLQSVGIPDPVQRLRSYPHEMSGGMRQRVSIATAIACSPRLLFADEPTTALDVTVQRQILDLLRRLQTENGMSMVLITHDLGVVASRADRIAVMYGGRVAEVAPRRALFTEMRHPYTKALLDSIPRIELPSRSPLRAVPGRPVRVVDPQPGCRFATRCPHAQQRCVEEDPMLTPAETPGHAYACFYPVGTPAGEEAYRTNRRAGITVTGLQVERCERAS